MQVLRSRATSVVLFSFFAVGAFATLGDGTTKKRALKNILSDKNIYIQHGGFSLKSGYNYRGNNVINPERQESFINLNTVAIFQKGNRTYILPIKSKVLLNNVKISAGIPQLNR
ncbi:MAG: hypothetical protein JWM28_3863 [Chitinophagaceae bacterium]|nr:hypothetical protein [Chitinophagaceae bacterium]